MTPRLTYSKNVFIPVTHLCRNQCGYCTFRRDQDGIISRKEALQILDLGKENGCTEALFTFGERPWEVPGSSASIQMEKDNLFGRLIELFELALERDLLPHTNAGVLFEEDMKTLAPYNASMGLMLETLAKVEAHRNSPGKSPKVRLEAIATAGRLKIPFTTGILVGIGESRTDRIRSLQALASLHRSFGHLQEVIVQPFDPKPGTPMAHISPPTMEALKDAVRSARSILPPSVSVQTPPNLAEPKPLIESGADDLGGISPVTSDWINPERPWPKLERLQEELSDYDLRERLPVYPKYIELGWHGKKTHKLTRRLAGSDGLAISTKRHRSVKDISDQSFAEEI